MGRVSDYAFINAKLRARIGIMRSESAIDEMIKAPTLSEAIAKLDGTKTYYTATPEALAGYLAMRPDFDSQE